MGFGTVEAERSLYLNFINYFFYLCLSSNRLLSTSGTQYIGPLVFFLLELLLTIRYSMDYIIPPTLWTLHSNDERVFGYTVPDG